MEKINTYITLAGPETVGNEYVNDFLDPKNHADGRAPVIMSHHAFLGMATGGVSGSTSGEVFFRAIDGFMTGNVAGIVKQRDLVASKTQLVLNEVRTMLLLLLLLLELVLLLVLLTLLLMLLILTSVLQWIPFLNDWCDPADAKRLFAKHSDLGKDPRWQGSATSGAACPNWQDPKSHGTKANRQTLGWNAAAAAFAYGNLGRQARTVKAAQNRQCQGIKGGKGGKGTCRDHAGTTRCATYLKRMKTLCSNKRSVGYCQKTCKKC